MSSSREARYDMHAEDGNEQEPAGTTLLFVSYENVVMSIYYIIYICICDDHNRGMVSRNHISQHRSWFDRATLRTGVIGAVTDEIYT